MNGSRKHLRAVALAAAWYAAAGAVSGQEAGKLTIEVGDCVKLESPDQRLACYEGRVNAALERGAAPRDAAPAPAVNSQAAAPRSVAREPQPPAREAQPAEAASTERRHERARTPAAQQRAASSETDEIVSRVQSLRETVPNAYMITLENGQVWRQMRPESYPLRPGQDVRIYGTRWGTASRLTADELKGFIQVERVQ